VPTSRNITNVLISIGTELTEGQFIDTNSAWISKQLRSIGLITKRMITAPDDLEQLIDSFETGLRHADVIISTGGLGATHDDWTRDAVTKVLGLNWALDEEAANKVRTMHAGWGVQNVPERAFAQALFPVQGARIPNDKGTALGFAVRRDQKMIICLPGVPNEMKHMVKTWVIPTLAKTYSLPKRKLLCDWMLYGITEEQAAEAIQPLERADLQTVILVDRGMIRVQVTAVEEEWKQRGEEWNRLLTAVEQKLAPWRYGQGGETVEAAFVRQVHSFEVVVIDEAAGGVCAALLQQACRNFPVTSVSGQHASELPRAWLAPLAKRKKLFIRIGPLQEEAGILRVQASLEAPNRRLVVSVQTPVASSHALERISRQILREALLFATAEQKDIREESKEWQQQ
jgi:nicotinamide-nucleotide amidase